MCNEIQIRRAGNGYVVEDYTDRYKEKEQVFPTEWVFGTLNEALLSIEKMFE